jgi:hypothetical protein
MKELSRLDTFQAPMSNRSSDHCVEDRLQGARQQVKDQRDRHPGDSSGSEGGGRGVGQDDKEVVGCDDPWRWLRESRHARLAFLGKGRFPVSVGA